LVFSSHIFIFYFLPATLLIYYALPRWGKHLGLCLLSYLFYGWANPYFIFLMFLSTVINYWCGLAIAHDSWRDFSIPKERLKSNHPHSRGQRVAVAVSVVTNLAILGFFKYANFGIDSYNTLVNGLGMAHVQCDTFFRITLPLGISFYTFQAMSYPIDIYRGDAKPAKSFIDFACYVSMFPQLVAGPIVRFCEVADQFQSRRHSAEKFARGVSFFCFGMAKKILLANACGKVADVCFEAGGLHVLDAWYGMFAYSFQIYFDFSGYSDMAIGLGLMLGFVFPKNFDSPYQSQSITEFWRRWHLSLSFWLRDYLYFALGGNRKGTIRTYANLAMVMLLGGLWHGAAWNFVVWGGIHGAMLAMERLQGKDSFYRRLPRRGRMAVTFLIASLAWVFFRAPDFGSAMTYLGHLIGASDVPQGAGLVSGLVYQPYYLLLMMVAVVVTWWMPQTWDFTRKLTWPKALWCLTLLALSIAVLTTQSFNPFIYFIF
jgi:alginate O-acetyltransferase complex protein AlgI